MWLANRGCNDTVLRAWESRLRGHPMFKVSSKLKKCKKMLNTCSKDHFGSVKKQIEQKRSFFGKMRRLWLGGVLRGCGSFEA